MPSSNYSSFDASASDNSCTADGNYSTAGDETSVTPRNSKHARKRYGSSSRNGHNTIQRFMRASLAWLAAFGAVLSIVGGALIATGSVASATTTTTNLRACKFSYGGVTAWSSATNGYLGILPVKGNVTVNISCSFSNTNFGAGIGASEASSLPAIATCSGSTCTGTNLDNVALGEANLNSAAFENCIFGCHSTWSTSFSTGNPWGAGGSTGSGFVNSAGDKNASCPTSPAPSGGTIPSASMLTNMGLWFCIAAVTDANGDAWGAVFMQYPTGSGTSLPADPTLATSSTTVSPGATVKLSDAPNNTSYWWGDPIAQVPAATTSLSGVALPAVPLAVYVCPATSSNPDPTPSSSCTVVQSSSASGSSAPVQISKPNYAINMNSSSSTYGYPSGSSTSGMYCPGGTDKGTCPMGPAPTPEKLSGSFTAPATAGQYAVEAYEGNPIYAAAEKAVAAGSGSVSGAPAGNCTSSQSSATSVPNCITAYSDFTVQSSTSSSPTITSISPTSGPAAGGTSVTITGKNFTSSATVKFGSTAATSVTHTSSTSLTAVSPAESAGTVQVTVTTSSGTSNGVSYTYTSSTSTAPTITSITPDSSPLAGGGTATIIGTNLSGVSGVNFGSTPATNVKSVSSTEVTATIPAATSPGLVEVTVQAGGKTSAGSGFMYVTSGIPYTPVTPYRIADTRCSASPQPAFCSQENLPSANQSLSSPPAGGSITVQVAGTGSGSNSVPSGAQSVVVTVTAIAGTTAKNGFLTVYPAGTNPPTASSLNYAPGMAIPNLVTATLGSGGAIDILSSSANVNIVVDVEGYYEPSTSTTTNKFTPLPVPVRVLDTRCEGALAGSSYCTGLNLPSANQLKAPGSESYIKVEVTGVDNIPLSATAVSLVVTAAGPSSGGYLTVFPAGSSTTPPETSNVNFHKGIASADSVTVAVGTGGYIYIYNSAGTATNVIVDVNGYFSSSGYVLTPSSPVRICDTRSLSPGDVSSGVSGQCANSGTPLTSSGGPITVQVTGIAGIPSTAKAVVANITVVNTTGGGYLTAWAAGATQPTTSNINWGKGQVMPNMVISTLNSSGQMDIYCSSQANIIIDVVGWYS